jgi:hypothetical protein
MPSTDYPHSRTVRYDIWIFPQQLQFGIYTVPQVLKLPIDFPRSLPSWVSADFDHSPHQNGSKLYLVFQIPPSSHATLCFRGVSAVLPLRGYMDFPDKVQTAIVEATANPRRMIFEEGGRLSTTYVLRSFCVCRTYADFFCSVFPQSLLQPLDFTAVPFLSMSTYDVSMPA